MSEGTTRAEAAAHILARETGRRMRAVQARIDEVEEQRKIALDAIASRLVAHDGSDERQDGLIDGLRADLGSVQQVASVIDQAHGETRELTAAQAQELARIAQRLTANEATDARQDGLITEVVDRIDVLEATAPVPGPKGEKGDRGPSGPRGVMGPPGVPGAVGSGTGGGGGNVNSVSVSSGLSITGTSDLTITNTGVRSLAGSGISVSGSTGAVTITAPTVTGGTGITVAGSGTTTLTVSATGVNSVSGGTGISVSGTTALTVSATGVNSVSAGTGISVSGTTALTVSATGVNSIVAGTAISVSGTTTITVNNTGVTALAGTGISVSAATGSVTVTPTYAAPTALAIGSTVVTGAAASVANSAHVHAMPGSAVAGASAVGDTAATGTATTVALSDHRHSREAFGTPVVVNGQTTALATGSLTTLARADHVHTLSNVPVLLASTTLGSAAASVTLSSIPQTHDTLWIQVISKSTVATWADSWNFRINGDTGSNYYWNGSSVTSVPLANVVGATFASSSPPFVSADLWLSKYTSSSRKAFHSRCLTASDSSFNLTINQYAGLWTSTAAVTSVTFIMQGGNFAVGSSVLIWGYPV